MTALGNKYFDEIIVEVDFDSSEPYAIVEMTIEFVDDAIAQALYALEDMPTVARWCYNVDRYACQVDNGGHGQFLANCDSNPAVLTDVAAGLAAMGAEDYLKLYTEFTDFLASDCDRADAVAAGAGFGTIDAGISAFDKRFHDLGLDMLAQHNAAMVLAYPALMPTPRPERRAALGRLAERNPRYAERRAVLDAKAAERDATPMGIAAQAIAEAAGLTLNHWMRGNPRTQQIIAIGTTTGPFLIKVDPDEASIYSKNGKLPWAYFDGPEKDTLITRVPLENGLPRR